jgi:ABC-2 type transport system permease protein
MLAPAIAQFIAPPDLVSTLTGQPSVHTLQWQLGLERLSPTQLFGESITTILSPMVRTTGPVFMEQLEGAIIGAPLPLAESLSIVWPEIVALVSGCILLFALAYVVFQRQEVRA